VQRRRGAIKEEESRQAETPREETRIVEDLSLGALAALAPWRLSSLVSLARISLTLH
jgi:hypothetical protein